jgi:UDP-2-acetamido-3-amino-2,3-dideoxy-glucuronate N-acetyltransferase
MRKKLKVAVIGAGNWGQNYLRILDQLGVLAGLADPQLSILKKFESVYPNIKVTADFNDLLNDPDINGIVVATPAFTHYEITKHALRADKDVLVEKPMTLNVAEAVELEEIASSAKRILMVGHLLLYKPSIQKMIEFVRTKVIGDVYFIEMHRLKLGKIRDQENVLWSFAPHDVAVLLSLVGANVVNVNAVGQAAIQSQVEDNVYLYLCFDNNVKAHIHISWLWPQDQRRTIVVGSKGMMVYDEIEDNLRIYRQGVNDNLAIWNEGMEELTFETPDILEREALHFLECIENRSVPMTDGNSGIDVVKVLVTATACLKETENDKNYFVHESAIVDPVANIGKGTQIWHYSHIMNNVEIGQDCKIGQNVFISSGVKIGNNVKIQNNVSVYQGVILEKDVFCGPSMVFTNVNTPRSGFPRNTPADYQVTLVKEGASIGANATILSGIVIGKCALIGAGAVVTKDVPDHAVVYGNPAQIHGWICRCGAQIASESSAVKCDQCCTEYNSY